MKLLDPFAGYRLASGHPIFHLAYFVGSWTVNYFEHEEDFIVSRGHIVDCFYAFRWVHFTVFLISILSGIADTPSNLPHELTDEDDEEDEQKQEKKLKMARILHRDTKWRTLARFLDTVCVFLYQGVVFYAQWNLVTSE